jgi:hypothetical protein
VIEKQESGDRTSSRVIAGDRKGRFLSKRQAGGHRLSAEHAIEPASMISQMSTQKSTEKTAITTTTCDQAALCIFFPQSFVFILVLFFGFPRLRLCH